MGQFKKVYFSYRAEQSSCIIFQAKMKAFALLLLTFFAAVVLVDAEWAIEWSRNMNVPEKTTFLSLVRTAMARSEETSSNIEYLISRLKTNLTDDNSNDIWNCVYVKPCTNCAWWHNVKDQKRIRLQNGGENFLCFLIKL